MKHRDKALLLYASLTVVAVALVLAWDMAPADEIQLPLGSYHFNKQEDKTYNEINPGILYARSVTPRWGLLGGVYKNTLNTASFVLGGQYRLPSGLGAQGGVATGYKEISGTTITPIASLFYDLPGGLRLSVIPHKYGAIGVSFVFDL